MRILQAGNANFGYIMARELRRRGIEADLLISYQTISGQNFSINDPKSHDPGISSYPDWVIFYDRDKKTKTFSIIQAMKKYDLVCAYNTLPLHAMLSGRPYVAVTGGDELRKKAFERSLTGYMLKRAYKKADYIVYTWPVAKPYLDRLGLDGVYIPRIWDAQSFARTAEQPTDSTLKIFHPTAQLWDLKGNENFLRAFARLCSEGRNVYLYYVDWGRDSQRAKSILAEPEAARRTKVIPGPVSRETLSEFMSKSDVLADQFNTGSFTRMGIEAFYFGIPVMLYLDEGLYRQAHGDLPDTLQCRTEPQIYEKILWAMDNKDRLKVMAAASREWVLRHFDLQKNVDRHVELYQKILKK